jgi:hypothetical protein
MIEGTVLSAATQRILTQYATHPPHALLLCGMDGVGKGTVAAHLVQQTLGLSSSAQLRDQPMVTYVEPDAKGTISIEQIRTVQQAVRLKTTGRRSIRRAVVIEHAQAMTSEAQNALLKVLEEPPTDTIIVVTVAQATDVLPTIQSRCQRALVTAPDKSVLVAHFSKQFSAQQVNQAYFLSGGLPGLMQALLDQDAQHPLVRSVDLAKGLLKGQLFDRLLYIEPIAKQREAAVLLCEALERIAEAGLQAAAQKDDTPRIKQWHAIIKYANQAQEQLAMYANTKLVLTNLILQL